MGAGCPKRLDPLEPPFVVAMSRILLRSLCICSHIPGNGYNTEPQPRGTSNYITRRGWHVAIWTCLDGHYSFSRRGYCVKRIAKFLERACECAGRKIGATLDE